MSDRPDPYQTPASVVGRWVNDRQHLMRLEAEDYLRGVLLDYEPRRRRHWNWDYSSPEAFERSVESNRRRWQEAVGAFEEDGTALDPLLEPWYEDEHFTAWWLTLGLLGGLRARGILALPKQRSGRVPLVIAQHGIGSSPERVFGLDDSSDIYKGYGRRLAEEGFAVIAPLNVTDAWPRARLERLC